IRDRNVTGVQTCALPVCRRDRARPLRRPRRRRPPGRARRATGSRAAAALSANDFSLTSWAFDAVPTIDLATWRLRVDGSVASPGSIDYGELLALPSTERDAVLDCTGGWWTEQRWRGVTLAHLLDRHAVRASAQRIDIVSLTGHAWSFPITEADRLLIATHVGGETLGA